MSLITRCPVCETMFKVVGDQFKVAQGWVRCGYCGEVFDAALHLVPADAAATAAGQPAPFERDAQEASSGQSDGQFDGLAAELVEPAKPAEPIASAQAIVLDKAPTPAGPEPKPDPESESESESPPSSSLPLAGVDAPSAASSQGDGLRKISVDDMVERLQQGLEPTAQGELAQDRPAQDGLAQDGTPVPALDPAEPASPAASLTDAETRKEPVLMHGREETDAADAEMRKEPVLMPDREEMDAADADSRKEPVLMPDRDETDGADAASAQASKATEPAAAGLEPSSDSDSLKPAESAPEVSFVRDARRRAFWEKPLVRGLLGLLALALLAALLLQWVLQQKDNLAALNPQLAPFLQALCEPLNCQIRPPRHIESLVIDSSSFSKVAPDVYRLSFVLKNNGPAVLEIPYVEVSLTDLQEQALVRRVLAPQEFGAGAVALAAHAELAAVMILQVSGEGAAGAAGAAGAPALPASFPTSSPVPSPVPLPITGYRILAFYP